MPYDNAAQVAGRGLCTLSDEELDVVSAGASLTFSFSSNQLGNTNSVGSLNIRLTQGVTGQNFQVSGTFTTT